VIAGSYRDSGGMVHGFIRAVGGSITSFDASKSASFTGAISINSEGAVVGYDQEPYESDQGFLRSPNGKITVIDLPGSDATQPWAINDKGVIAGQYWTGGEYGTWHGFVRTADGAFVSFDPPGSASTIVSSINNKGAIVGTYSGDNGVFGFLRAPDGTITTVEVGHAQCISGGRYRCSTHDLSINGAGVIAGDYNNETSSGSFVRATDGTVTAFTPPGSLGTQGPVGINEKGQVAGTYVDISLRNHCYVRDADGKFKVFDPPKSNDTFCSSIDSHTHGILITGFFQQKKSGSESGFLRAP
jgi:hypothetical protein